MLSAIQIAGFLNQPFLQNKSMKQPYFLHVETNLQKLKVDQTFFWLCMARNGCGKSGLWTLKLIVSQEWTNGINWFFSCWYHFTQTKRWSKIFRVSMFKNECGQSGDRTLKLTVSEEWTRWNKPMFCMLIHDNII